MQSFKSFISEESSDKPVTGPIHSAKAERKIQSTTGAEKAFRRFISGDFRKNKTFGKDPGLAAKQSQAAMKANPVAANVQKRIKSPIKPVMKPVNKVNVTQPKNVPVPVNRPVNNVSDTAAVSKKPVVKATADVKAGTNLQGANATVKRPSSGALNMVPNKRRYNGGVLQGLTSRKPAQSADDPKSSNAISADKARREPINADKYKGTPQAERDRADSMVGGPRKPPEKKVNPVSVTPSSTDAKSSNAISADQSRREPIDANKYKGTPQAERDRADSFKGYRGTPEKKVNSTPVKDNNPIIPNKTMGNPQAERDREDSKKGYPGTNPDGTVKKTPLEVSNAKRDQIKAAIAQRRLAEERKKDETHHSLLGGKGLELRYAIRNRISNQKNSPSRYNTVKEEEKKLGDTETGEAGETIDVKPKKKELTGQER